MAGDWSQNLTKGRPEIADAECTRSGFRGAVLLMAVLLAGPLALPAVAEELRVPAVLQTEQTSAVRRLSATVVRVLRGLLDDDAVVQATPREAGFSPRASGVVAVARACDPCVVCPMRAHRLDLLDLPPPLA